MLSLLGRTLVVVAHPDDEAGGCGVLLQRIEDPIVLFTTDGAPDDHWFWASYHSREAYAAARREEAIAALSLVRISHVVFVADQFPSCSDQHLYGALPTALQAIARAVLRYRPHALLTTAYEGGHPDHDACSFLCNLIGKQFALPVWEMPMYHRIPDGRLVCQEFLEPNGSEFLLTPTEAELARKWEMLACYQSQSGLPAFVVNRCEHYRRQPEYRYTAPPHEGMLNYEAWQWPVRGSDVCNAFTACLHDLAERAQRRPVIAQPASTVEPPLAP